MTDQQPHAPSLDQMRDLYVRHADQLGIASDHVLHAEFDRFLAAAEQRGAARAFKESANEVRREMRWQYAQNINRNSDTGDSIDRLLELEKVFKYRADLLEGDDAQSST